MLIMLNLKVIVSSYFSNVTIYFLIRNHVKFLFFIWIGFWTPFKWMGHN